LGLITKEEYEQVWILFYLFFYLRSYFQHSNNNLFSHSLEQKKGHWRCEPDFEKTLHPIFVFGPHWTDSHHCTFVRTVCLQTNETGKNRTPHDIHQLTLPTDEERNPRVFERRKQEICSSWNQILIRKRLSSHLCECLFHELDPSHFFTTF
jgi:hypothetical protein